MLQYHDRRLHTRGGMLWRDGSERQYVLSESLRYCLLQ